MAEEKKGDKSSKGDKSPKKDTLTEDLLLGLFAILLVGQIFQQLPVVLQEKFGITLPGAERSGVLVAGAALTADTPMGTKVNAPRGTPLYANPGGGTTVGDVPPGTSLTIWDGPVTDDYNIRWWYVEAANTGKIGWVPEGALVKEGAGGIGPRTEIGTKARAMLGAELWDRPGSTVKAGLMAVGEWGILKDGPVERDGTRWWFFDRDDSKEDGWVPESALTLFSDKEWGKGTMVIATRAIDLYERAGGGDVTGFLREDEQARILDGPVLSGGMYWWLVQNTAGEQGWVPESALKEGGFRGFWKKLTGTVLIIGALITLGLLSAIVYLFVRTSQIQAREMQRIKSAIPKRMQEKRNDRWEKVLEHVASDNPNDWRLAIIEADVMLDEVITRMGYMGNSLGDKLKGVVRGDLKMLDAAWEAHRVRNQIAHEGSDYILTQREARRIIELYSLVFQELKYI